MLLVHSPSQTEVTVEEHMDIDREAFWFDLVNPSPEEISKVEKVTGLIVPDRASLETIENSSRFYFREETLYLSASLLKTQDNRYSLSPAGFVLTTKYLITIRYSDFSSFQIVSKQVSMSKLAISPYECVVMLLEAIVDRFADVLENVGYTLERLSRDVFRSSKKEKNNATHKLRGFLKRVGKAGDTISTIKDSMLGVDRLTIFVEGNIQGHLSDELKGRLSVIVQDIKSFNDFTIQATNKVQFLLDAILGFISIEQNDSLRVMTVASVVAVIPTLIAGIYGMNFRNMPELSWYYGYHYSLTLMGFAIIVPLIWFWRRGWLIGLGSGR